MALSLSARSPHTKYEIFQGKNYIESIPELINLMGFIHKARFN